MRRSDVEDSREHSSSYQLGTSWGATKNTASYHSSAHCWRYSSRDCFLSAQRFLQLLNLLNTWIGFSLLPGSFRLLVFSPLCSHFSSALPTSRNVMLHGARSECSTRQRSCPLFFEKVGLQPSSRGGFHLEDGVPRPLFPYVSL